MPLLSVIVPAYNAASYLERCIDSLLGGESLQVIIVDDGSTDDTGRLADVYAARHPDRVRVIHKANGGHGSAINAGIEAATGIYCKVVDSDDWVDPAALRAVIEALTELTAAGTPPDALISNFVYEKVGRRTKTTVRYNGLMPQGRVFGWDEVGRFRKRQYLMMHSLLYRTDVLRASGLRLPEHTYYVDNLFVTVPLPHVESLFYLDVDLYRYFIGRPDQSVNEAVMIRRIDQQLRVNRLLVQQLPAAGTVPDGLYRYLLHHLEIVCAVTSVMLLRTGGSDALAHRTQLWREIRAHSPWVHARLRRSLLSQSTNLPGFAGRRVSVLVYHVARRVVGFN